MKEKIIDYLKTVDSASPAQVASAIGYNRRPVTTCLAELATEHPCISVGRMDVGYNVYIYRENTVKSIEKTIQRARRKPFSANAIAGAYLRGNDVVIKLSRRNNAQSVTLSKDDVTLINSLTTRK